MNFYKRFPGDYVRDTMHLSMIEDGAYSRMLDWCYANEAPLPLDRLTVYRITRASTPAEKRAVDSVLGQFFDQGPTGFTQSRVKSAVEAHAVRVHINTEVGRMGGRPITETVSQSDTETVTPTVTETKPTDIPSHVDSHQPSAINKSKAKATPKAAVPPTPLPAWLDPALWQHFREHRRAKRAAMTPRAEELLIGKLDDLRSAGDDPRQVIERSIERGWSGLFHVQPTGSNGQRGPPSLAERRVNTIDSAIRNGLNGSTKASDERTIEGSAERVDSEAADALPGDLREPGRHRLRHSG